MAEVRVSQASRLHVSMSTSHQSAAVSQGVTTALTNADISQQRNFKSKTPRLPFNS